MRIPVLIVAVALMAAGTPAEASFLSIAQKYVGMSERGHRATLRRLLRVDPVRTPWCGAFASAVVRKAGRSLPRGSNIARSWLRFGKSVRLSAARAGDVVVLSRHVGFLHSRKRGKVCLLGGNQSNQVKITCYRAGSVRGVRR